MKIEDLRKNGGTINYFVVFKRFTIFVDVDKQGNKNKYIDDFICGSCGKGAIVFSNTDVMWTIKDFRTATRL